MKKTVFSAVPAVCTHALKCARRGEADTEKGPVDLFPAEPTEELARALRYEPV